MSAILDSLGFVFPFFVAQIFLFIVLLVVMNQIFWKPVLAHLRVREQTVSDAYRTVETTRHEMESIRAEYQSRINKIEAEARSHIQTAIKEAQTERERILAEAREQSDATLRNGVEAMEREKTEALQSLRERMAGLAMTAVQKALGAGFDASAVRRSIDARISTIAGDAANAARN